MWPFKEKVDREKVRFSEILEILRRQNRLNEAATLLGIYGILVKYAMNPTRTEAVTCEIFRRVKSLYSENDSILEPAPKGATQ